MRLCHKNSDFCMISESHCVHLATIPALCFSFFLCIFQPDGTSFFSSKPRKIFNLFWRPRYSKSSKISLIWILVQTIFFMHAIFEFDHWESKRVGPFIPAIPYINTVNSNLIAIIRFPINVVHTVNNFGL